MDIIPPNDHSGQTIPQDPLAFLRWLYGDEAPGWLTIFTLPGEHTEWFRAHHLERATAYALQESSTHDVYFGVGLRRGRLSKGRGKSGDVQVVPGLYMDFDLKHRVHKKPNLPETVDDIRRLISQTIPLPPTILVHSGYGLHGYWLFRELSLIETDDERQWITHLNQRLHAAFQTTAKRYGWTIDSVFNLDRVLRIPGTYNRILPDDVKLVTIIDADEHQRYNPSDLDEHLPDLEDASSNGQPFTDDGEEIPLIDLETLPIQTWLKYLIAMGRDPTYQGKHPSRSEAHGHATEALLKAGIDERIILSLLLDDRYQISERPREKGRAWLVADISRIKRNLNGHRSTTDSTPRPDDPPAQEAPRNHTNVGDDRPEEECPALPEIAGEDSELIARLVAEGSPWLDDYMALSRRWAPRAYDDFHEACGVFTLSTVAARRVHIELGPQGTYTSLYALLCSRTSLWTKSTTAAIALGLMKAVGLSALLAPDNSTPQAFLSGMVPKLPDGYDDLPDEAQQLLKLRIAFAGQRGWFYEEFGQHLSAMMQRDNIMRAFHGILRRFDDHKADDSTGTIVRGHETIDKPYLALLGNMTPTDLRPFARKGSALWTDGYFARFAFIVAPLEGYKEDQYPKGKLVYPLELIKPLRDWHERLGVPNVRVDPVLDPKHKDTGRAQVRRDPLPEHTWRLSEVVWDAYYAYDGAIRQLMSRLQIPDIEGSYVRFPTKALRVAGLLASLEGKPDRMIHLRHWYRARAIVERWRASLHRLITQLADQIPGETREQLIESHIERAIRRSGALSIRELHLKIGATYNEIHKAIDSMRKAGVVEVDQEHSTRTSRYRLIYEP